MGWTWSLYFTQSCNLDIMNKVLELQTSKLMRDRGPPAVFTPGQASRSHYIYVDNLGVVSEDCEHVVRSVAALCARFGKVGLPVHETGVHAGGGQTFGIVLDGRRY